MDDIYRCLIRLKIVIVVTGLHPKEPRGGRKIKIYKQHQSLYQDIEHIS